MRRERGQCIYRGVCDNMCDRGDDRKGCIGPPLAVASITTAPTLLSPPPSVCGEGGGGLAPDRASAGPQPDVRVRALGQEELGMSDRLQ